MIITDISTIPTSSKRYLEHNPFKTELEKIKSERRSFDDNIRSMRSSILSYKQEVEKYERNIRAYTEKERINKRNEARVQVAYDNALDVKASLNWLKPELMTGFFKSIGMTFISLKLSNSGNEAVLSFVRPASFINSLPVQPMVCSLSYRENNGVLVVSYAYCYVGLQARNNHHPHISGDSVCMGNYFDVLQNQGSDLMLESYQDHVIMLDSLLSTYNPDSPYLSIDQIITNLSSYGMSEYTTSVSVDSTSYVTVVNPKLNDARTSYKVKDIITRKAYEQYYESLKTLKTDDVLEDIEARVMMLQHNGGNDAYHALENLSSSFDSLPNSSDFDDHEDYAEYDDEHDEYYVSEDSFDSCKVSWLKAIKETRKAHTGGTMTIGSLPSLDAMFPHTVAPQGEA